MKFGLALIAVSALAATPALAQRPIVFKATCSYGNRIVAADFTEMPSVARDASGALTITGFDRRVGGNPITLYLGPGDYLCQVEQDREQGTASTSGNVVPPVAIVP